MGIERRCVVSGCGHWSERMLLVAEYGSDRNALKLYGSHARFWDVVGDTIMSVVCRNIRTGITGFRQTIYLLPDLMENDGNFYTKQAVIDLSEKANCRLVMLRGVKECAKWRFRSMEGNGDDMAGKINLPSLEEYRKQRGQQDNTDAVVVKVLEDADKPQEISISPFSNSKSARISETAHRNALRFAHPIDQSVISALDNQVVNTVFNKVVQASIDANYGLALARGIHVSPNTYGEIYNVIADCAEKLSIPIPYVIISDTVQGINACTAGTDQFSFIAISSFLPVVMNREELTFVIGHECGHLALGHVVYHTALNVIGTAGGLLPLVGSVIEKTIRYPLNAWSRRSEISADRAGLICCGDVQIAKRSLFKLEAGLLKADDVDIDGYVREAEQILDNSSLGRFSEIMYSHPIIPKRIKALDYFSRSRLYDSITGKGNDTGDGLFTDSELASKIEQIIEIKL